MTGMRRNWRHQVTRRIADTADTVCVEDLHVRGMTRSARGTVDKPGSRVRQKAGLNRIILATGWAEMRRMLSYKAGQLVAVDPAWTSRHAMPAGMSMPVRGGPDPNFSARPAAMRTMRT